MGPSGSSKTTLLGDPPINHPLKHCIEAVLCLAPHLALPRNITCSSCADVLAGRKTVGAISGKVMFGGHHASKNFLRRYTGYVEQFGGRPRLMSCDSSCGSSVCLGKG